MKLGAKAKPNLFVISRNRFFFTFVDSKLGGEFELQWQKIARDPTEDSFWFRIELGEIAREIENRLDGALSVILMDREIFSWDEDRFVGVTPFSRMKDVNQPIVVLATHDPEEDRNLDKDGVYFDLITRPDIKDSEFMVHIESAMRRHERVRAAQAKVRGQKRWTTVAGVIGVLLGALFAPFPFGNYLWPGMDCTILPAGLKKERASYVLVIRNTSYWTLTGCEIKSLPKGYNYEGIGPGMAIDRIDGGSVKRLPFQVVLDPKQTVCDLVGDSLVVKGPRKVLGLGSKQLTYPTIPAQSISASVLSPAIGWTQSVLVGADSVAPAGAGSAACTPVDTTCADVRAGGKNQSTTKKP